jgi:hypothetical protein
MKVSLMFLSCLTFIAARAEVRVFVQEENRMAAIKYECTEGEVIRSFALNVTVDRGQIIGITNFFRGESTLTARGYGIFPAAFRDHIKVPAGTNITWMNADYTPLADVDDRSADTLPGLNSRGVTLGFGGLWNPALPAAIPPSRGTLCTLQISQAANISVAPNLSRGGVIATSSDANITPTFTGTFVDPDYPAITGLSLTQGIVTIHFVGGELFCASTLDGIWVGTGNTNGVYIDAIEPGSSRFHRVLHR